MSKFIIYLAAILLSASTAVAQSDAFYFVQMSDPQFGMLEGNKEFSKETKLMEQAVKAVNKLNPEFIVFTGDLVNDWKDKKQIAEFQRILGQIKKETPVYVLPGNHDFDQKVSDEALSAYLDEYGYDSFSFHTKNTCFIGLNTPVIFADKKDEEQSQLVWMERVLRNSQKCNHRILFTHYPFFVETPDEADQYFNIPLTKRGNYIDLFNKYNVDAMFAGHLHRNADGSSGNFRMVTTSALCYPLGKDKVGFRIVKVYPDRIESEYYDLDNIPSKVDL
ncbi:metallophosphoesterase [Parabacteroides bouchesdurhonensis]|uniref:metallophosphoesterase n=1 Tax=Parabacteroides bouchesdurhonensis TaxID=1936995 RepID=UPI000E46B16D|nr:metallophosphoesterase [Parabacteroides bouchesdurhonensis]RHJ94944.1 metallophosphatase [Bacteroides sp. AM07-16]